MNLMEVIDVLKEMVNGCSDLEGDDFLLAPSKIPGSTVEGYEIHMTGKFDEATKKYINDFALEKKLAITQHPDSVMIYKTKKVQTNKPQPEEI